MAGLGPMSVRIRQRCAKTLPLPLFAGEVEARSAEGEGGAAAARVCTCCSTLTRRFAATSPAKSGRGDVMAGRGLILTLMGLGPAMTQERGVDALAA